MNHDQQLLDINRHLAGIDWSGAPPLPPPQCLDVANHAAGCSCGLFATLDRIRAQTEALGEKVKALALETGVHVHEYHRIFHQSSPPCDVEDCGCGARRRVYPGPSGQPTIVDEVPKPGGAAENCLIVVDHQNGYASLLGDPQGERFNTTLKQEN